MKKITPVLSVLLAAILLSFPLSTGNATTIYFISDSAVTDCDPAVYPNQRGWGQMLRQFLTGDINYVNAARSGRSSMSFYKEGLWKNTVYDKLEPGDYVFIQWNGNDEKDGGITGPSGVGTAPCCEFREYNIKYIEETRSKGAIPILFTPIVRCYFSGNTITDKGAHNLWDPKNGPDDGSLNYPKVTRELAAEYSVQLVDMTPVIKAFVESYGPADAKNIIYVEADNSHLSIVGATLFARIAVQEMVKVNLLTEYLNASPDILLNPSNLSFGNCYVSTYSSRSFTLSGMDLDPANGQINITASDGFLVSLSETNGFSANISIDYTKANLAITNVFVRFMPNWEGLHTGTITVIQNSLTENAKIITLDGNAISSSGGIPAQVYFPLKTDPNAIVTGPVISLGQSYSNMKLYNYQALSNAIWPDGLPATERTQRNVINTEGNRWPGGEIDLVTDRYIQFVVKPQSGTVFTVDSVGFYIGASGGSGMGYRVMASNSDDFSNAIVLANKPNGNVNGTMLTVSYRPIWQIPSSEAFFLRIYPWYSAEADGKALCVANLTIKGLVTMDEQTHINAPETRNGITLFPNPVNAGETLAVNLNTYNNARIRIYTLAGILVSEQTISGKQSCITAPTQQGSYIGKIISDNTIDSVKLIVK